MPLQNASQAVAAPSRSSTRLSPLRPSTHKSAALCVVAFREDDNVRRGTREAKSQAKNVQRQGQRAVDQGKQQLQRGRNDLDRRKCAVMPSVLTGADWVTGDGCHGQQPLLGVHCLQSVPNGMHSHAVLLLPATGPH
jgi:hypothetical protein